VNDRGTKVRTAKVPAVEALDAANLLTPDWPAPPSVRAFTTTRRGGVSTGARASLNLGEHSGDDPECVAENRRRFGALLPSAPGWLRQVHGNRVVRRETLGTGSERGDDLGSEPGKESGSEAPCDADGAWTDRPGLPCTILTADCLPVLFCDRAGTVVAAVHAGWRGLAAGILEAAVAALPVEPARLLAWIGPGIGVGAYEVGEDFEAAFRRRVPWLDTGFERHGGRVHADLERIARAMLRRAGVGGVHGGGFCTYTERERFFSHRRDPASGRMATVIWLT
jgi:YfiH family protein